MKTQWIAGAVVALVAIGLLLVPAFGRVGTTSGVPVDVQTAVFAVQRLSCGACVDTIRKEVARLDGIAAVETDLGRGTTTVRFDPARNTPARIAATITAAGYPATPVAAAAGSSQAAVNPAGCAGGCCAKPN